MKFINDMLHLRTGNVLSKQRMQKDMGGDPARVERKAQKLTDVNCISPLKQLYKAAETINERDNLIQKNMNQLQFDQFGNSNNGCIIQRINKHKEVQAGSSPGKIHGDYSRHLETNELGNQMLSVHLNGYSFCFSHDAVDSAFNSELTLLIHGSSLCHSAVPAAAGKTGSA